MSYSNQSANQTAHDLVNLALDTFSAAFHRKVSEQTRDLWHELFDHERPTIIGKAIHEICVNDDKLPTIKRMLEAMALFKPNRMNSPTYTPGFDSKGIPCVYWSDEPNIPAYRAIDCPNGREALLTLARIANKTPEQVQKWFDGIQK